MGAWFDDLRLDFSRAETREALELLLIAHGSVPLALDFAKTTGIDTTTIKDSQTVRSVMMDIMQAARSADRLQKLLGEAMNDPRYSAIGKRLAELCEPPKAVADADTGRKSDNLYPNEQSGRPKNQSRMTFWWPKLTLPFWAALALAVAALIGLWFAWTEFTDQYQTVCTGRLSVEQRAPDDRTAGTPFTCKMKPGSRVTVRFADIIVKQYQQRFELYLVTHGSTWPISGEAGGSDPFRPFPVKLFSEVSPSGDIAANLVWGYCGSVSPACRADAIVEIETAPLE